jgi:glycosyltransferase involved in cell wall biosynthesis
VGAVSFSLDPKLLQELAKFVELDVLCETGTFHGDTVASAIPYFNCIYSIELSEALFKDALTRFADETKAAIFHGRSPELIRKLVPELTGRHIVFWLDAHWCVADSTAGERSQCPLLEEIRAIGLLDDCSIVLIDDARLFLSPPAAPHEIAQWPSFQAIVESLSALAPQHELMIVNDVIAFFPAQAREAFVSYARKYGVDWLRATQSLEENAHLRKQLLEKERVISTLKAPALLLEEKDATIQNLRRAIKAYRSAFLAFKPVLIPLNWIARRAFALLRPRLGNLYQHPPREICLPNHYFDAIDLTSTPRVSIVTPSFQQARFIERTIASVLEQGYPNLEYLVQDGGSKDGTVEILRRYSDRLAGWKSLSDKGQGNALNLAFGKTSGDIMAWLNSDDILLPGALSYVVEYFNQHPEVDVVYGDRILIDVNDLQIGRWLLPKHSDSVLSWVDYIPQETLFWRRRLWEKIGGRLDETFSFAIDWDLLVRFRDAGACFTHLPRFLGGFRVHAEQKTSASIAAIGCEEMDRIRQRLLGHQPSWREIRKAVMPYLLRHVLADIGWRVRNKLGFPT